MKFVYVRSTCSQAVLNKGLKHELHQLKKLGSILLTNSLSVLNIRSKPYPLQMMKLV